jgi:hypothetical protein
MIEALMGSAKYNDGMTLEWQGGEARLFYKGTPLVKTQEGRAFVMRCNGRQGGQEHFRYLTLNAARDIQSFTAVLPREN